MLLMSNIMSGSCRATNFSQEQLLWAEMRAISEALQSDFRDETSIYLRGYFFNDIHLCALAFELSNNKWLWWMWFPSNLQAGLWLKSVGLSQSSAAYWRCSAFITWTGWTLTNHNDCESWWQHHKHVLVISIIIIVIIIIM